MKEREMPLTALRAFAIAAASQNLETAAKELGVTHGAVSKQIALLEEWLGQSLFARHRRGLELSPYGRILAAKVSEAMQEMSAACDYVRRDRSRRVISVEAPTTFAMYFLLPRIKAFEARHARLSVWISTRHTGQTAGLSMHDVVVSRGQLVQDVSRIGASRFLFQEKLTPVGASSLLRETPVRRPEDIGKHKAIASSSRPGEWESWFSHAGLGRPLVEGGHRFDHQYIALHAVRDGIGLTLAPLLFFSQATNQYRLRCPLPDVTIPGYSYVAYSTHRSETALADDFIVWMQQQCRLAENPQRDRKSSAGH